ncbi:MAG: hypothetical protein ACFCBU_06550, partial [Cyanophyceae cyanobacterium]
VFPHPVAPTIHSHPVFPIPCFTMTLFFKINRSLTINRALRHAINEAQKHGSQTLFAAGKVAPYLKKYLKKNIQKISQRL